MHLQAVESGSTRYMSPHGQQYEIDKQRQQDCQREAEQHRLAQVARGNRHKVLIRLASVYKPTLFRLGKQLESIGTTLQIRYGDLKPSPLEQ